MSEIKQPVKDLAEALKKDLTVNKDGTTEVAADTYIKNMPEGVTEEMAKAVQSYNTNFIAAATLAVGETSIPVMKKNKDLERVSAVFPTIGKDNVSVVFDRVRENSFTNPQTKERELVIKNGATTVGYEVYGAKSKGSLAAVRAHLNEQAAAALAEAMK